MHKVVPNQGGCPTGDAPGDTAVADAPSAEVPVSDEPPKDARAAEASPPSVVEATSAPEEAAPSEAPPAQPPLDADPSGCISQDAPAADESTASAHAEQSAAAAGSPREADVPAEASGAGGSGAEAEEISQGEVSALEETPAEAPTDPPATGATTAAEGLTVGAERAPTEEAVQAVAKDADKAPIADEAVAGLEETPPSPSHAEAIFDKAPNVDEDVPKKAEDVPVSTIGVDPMGSPNVLVESSSGGVEPSGGRAAVVAAADTAIDTAANHAHADRTASSSAETSSLPGLVVYVVAPAAASGEAALSSDEFQSISAAAVRSGATVILSAASPAKVALLDVEMARVGKVLRPVASFASSRFKSPDAPAGGDVKSFGHLFDALDHNDSGSLDAEAIELGLKRLGYAGEHGLAAEAIAPAGTTITKKGFCEVLHQLAEQPDLVVACLSGDTIEGEDLWPVSRSVVTGAADLLSEDVLSAKVAEALRLAGHGASSHGLVLVLTARARTLLPGAMYEKIMRAELEAVQKYLPPRWPLLWAPAPAELGLLPAAPSASPGSTQQRALWELPKTAGASELVGWLRYLLVVRPAAPAG